MYLATETHLSFLPQAYQGEREREREREIPSPCNDLYKDVKGSRHTIIPSVLFFHAKLPPGTALCFILPLLNLRGESGHC